MSDSTFRHLKADTIRGQATAKNYIRNAFAAENVNQWATYSNTAQSTPVNGTGASGGTQTVAQVTTANATANSINTSQYVGQSFTTTTSTTVLSASFNLDQVGGTGATGAMYAAIYTVSGGNPGTLLGTSNSVDASTLTSTPTNITFNFTSGPVLSASTQYFVVFQPSGVTFNSATIEIHRDSTNPYAGGNATISLNAGSTWTPVPGSDLTFSVIGTGGINVTLTRNTSNPLRNEADFLFTKDAANRQGQGVSYDFTIDKADTGKRLAVQFDYLASANFVTGSASDIQVFLYDVTNSVLIYPDSSIILTASGTYQRGFQTTSSTSYRLIFHIATTNALAYTLEFTNVSVSQSPLLVTSNPNHNFYTGYHTNSATWSVASVSSFTDFGVSGTATLVQRLNNNIGTVSTAASNLAGITFTPVNSSASYRIVAKLTISNSSNARDMGVRMWDGTTVIDDSVYYLNANPTNTAGGVIFVPIVCEGIYSPGTTSPVTITLQAYGPLGNNQIISGGANFNIEWIIEQLTGYDAVASVSNANLSMAGIIANGTNVTSAPAAIGQYRTLIRNPANSNTGADTSGSGAVSAANGMHIYTVPYNTAGTSGQPNKWEIFVGKNKTVNTVFYASAGRVGGVQTDYYQLSTAIEVGLMSSYDPSTGIVIVDGITTNSGTNVARYVGWAPAEGTIDSSVQTDCYFDIIVADNQFQIQVQSPFQMFVSNQVTTDSSTVTSSTFVTASNSPAFTFTPSVSGLYKVYSAPNLLAVTTANSQTSFPVCRIFNTSANATLVYESQSAVVGAVGIIPSPTTAVVNVGASAFAQSVYRLNAGVSYQFDIQIRDPSAGNVSVLGTSNPFYMFAELCGA